MREVRWRSTKSAARARMLHSLHPTRRGLAYGPMTVTPTRSAGTAGRGFCADLGPACQSLVWPDGGERAAAQDAYRNRWNTIA
jgi:hypothetical protein